MRSGWQRPLLTEGVVVFAAIPKPLDVCNPAT